jgi:hypothetical protein
MNTTLHAHGRRSVTVIAVAALLANALIGCGSSRSSSHSTSNNGQSAASFISQVITQFSRGQSGPLWDTLHPTDQTVVSRARYMACQKNEGFGLTKIKVLQTYSDSVNVGDNPQSSTAVSIRVTADDGVTTATMHAVKVNGTWRWMLSPSDYTAYKTGKCPSS